MVVPNFRASLVTAKNLASGSVSFQPRVFGRGANVKAQERRIQVAFPTANAPVSFYHGLGRMPTQFVPVCSSKGAAVGGKIYSDVPIQGDTRSIILKCDVAGTSGEVIVR